MTTSPVEIGNLALQHLGVTTFITDLTELSKEARNINLRWDRARRQALGAFDWSFARKRAALAVHGTAAPEDDWGYRYEYPADCLKARKIFNPFGWPDDAVPFSLETTASGAQMSILTDMESAELIYTFDQTNYDIYPEHFIELLSVLLAYHIAYPITTKREVKGDMLNIYQNLLSQAPAVDANENVDRGPRDAEWIRARGYTSYPRTIFER